ncbi:MAG: hypothetical protein J0J00_07550, partial [Microbacterium sp.]|nr:hypothetical protein [Microbacterium sp.]
MAEPMSICDVPVIASVCDAVGEGTASLISAPFDWLAQAMGQAAAWLFESVWAVFDSTTLVDVTGSQYVSVYNVLFGVAIFVMLVFFCLQLITGLVHRDPMALSRAGVGLAKSVLGSFVAITLTATLLEVTDQLTIGIVQATGNTMEGIGDRMALLAAGLTTINIASPGGDTATFQIVAIVGDAAITRETLTEAFAAGADDVIPADADAEGVQIRIRTLLRRKLMQDEDRRIEAELRNREIAIERARAEAAAAEAKANLADALAQANSELGHANRSLRDTQAKLVQAAKMASLGELVAGIAHEINNPLAFILAHQGTVERLLGQIEAAGDDAARLPVLAKARDRLGAMRMGLKRIEALVQNLRKFSRLDEGGFQSIDVAAAIETVLALLAPKLSGRITVQRDLRGPSELMCSPALFNQVVMNIIG